MTLQLYFYLFVSFKDNFFFSGIEVKQTVMALPIRGSRSCYITSSLNLISVYSKIRKNKSMENTFCVNDANVSYLSKLTFMFGSHLL